MHAALEYIGVTIALIVILLASQYSLYTFLRNTSCITGEQLYTVAQRVVDKIVLTTGTPPNWGTRASTTIEDFGLAMQGVENAYTLDPDKVMRLINSSQLPNPLYLNSTYIADLLGLKENFGFILEIQPLIHHNITTIGYYTKSSGHGHGHGPKWKLASAFSILVTNCYGMRVPSANVTGTYLLIKVKSGPPNSGITLNITIFKHTVYTNITGGCTLDFTPDLASFFSKVHGSLESYTFILVVFTDWHGLKAVDVYSEAPANSPVTGYLSGDYLILNSTAVLQGAAKASSEVVEVIPAYGSMVWVETAQLACTGPVNPAICYLIGPANYRIYKISYVDRLATHIVAIAKWKGEYIPIVINRLPRVKLIYGTYRAPFNAVIVTRNVYLLNYPYVVKLTLWRVTEGVG